MAAAARRAAGIPEGGEADVNGKGSKDGDAARAESAKDKKGGRPYQKGKSDYRREDDGSAQVDEAKVTKMLADRLQAKMRKDFASADGIRDGLKAMGVWVNDTERTWKATGGGGGGGGGVGRDGSSTSGNAVEPDAKRQRVGEEQAKETKELPSPSKAADSN